MAAIRSTLTALAATAFLVACNTTPHDPWDPDRVAQVPAGASAFDKALHAEYVALARTERAEDDWIDARQFLERAVAITGGTAPDPEALEARELPAEHVEALSMARAELAALLDQGARALAPADAAKAQAMFDCWMQEQEENIIPEQLPDIAFCRDGYTAALARVKEKMPKGIVVLLPDLDGKVGSLGIQDAAGKSVTLDKPLQAARDGGETFDIDEKAVKALFGKALDAQPIPPKSFLLYFLSGGSELTEDSKKRIPEVRADIEKRPVYEIEVIGHTDRVGGFQTNGRLSEARARAIRELLIQKGFDGKHITASGHGEANPLVRTKDGVDEPQNRRVEINVR